MDKASAKAQMYCDVIMTYVEKTPSNDPYDGWDSLTDAQKNANKLFNTPPNQTYAITSDIKNKIDTPIYEQISTQIKNAVLEGKAAENEQLPSIRQLAKDLKISFITTTKS